MSWKAFQLLVLLLLLLLLLFLLVQGPAPGPTTAAESCRGAMGVISPLQLRSAAAQ